MKTDEVNAKLDNARRRCVSCSAPVVGRFCQDCGQKHRDGMPSLPQFLGESAQSAFELDGPVLRTLRDLILRPGALSKAYIRGDLSSYISPAKTFIFASAFYFLITHFVERNNFMFLRTGDEVRAQFYRESSNFLLLALVPCFACYLYLIHPRRRLPYMISLVVSSHIHCAWFVFLASACSIQWFFNTQTSIDVSDVPLRIGYIVCITYLGLTCKRVYSLSAIVAIIESIVGMAVYSFLLFLLSDDRLPRRGIARSCR
ncbi:MAG: DUF3667 domain-containing protein, partial [Planctomycetota bacterium]